MAEIPHGLASSVPSQSSLDVNLRMFDVVGRVGSHGLWELYCFNVLELQGRTKEAEAIYKRANQTATLLEDVIRHNRVLYTPIKDNQAVDINIACLFLYKLQSNDTIKGWVRQIAIATTFAFHMDIAYPCIFNEYRDLVDHPRCDDPDYRDEATVGSILIPTLAVWGCFARRYRDSRHVGRFCIRSICTFHFATLVSGARY